MLEPGFYNMDCMEGMKQFPDKFFDIAIVDPPYGGVTQGGYMRNQISGGVAQNKVYHLAIWGCKAPTAEYFAELIRVSKNQVIWGGNYYANMLPNSQCWIVWDKCKPEGVSYADFEMAWTSFDRAARLFRFMWHGMLQGDMQHKETKIHPTQKPIALYKWILDNFSNKNDVVLDTHVGSASSLIACYETGHEYYGFEIDPIYYADAKKRLFEAESQVNMFGILNN